MLSYSGRFTISPLVFRVDFVPCASATKFSTVSGVSFSYNRAVNVPAEVWNTA